MDYIIEFEIAALCIEALMIVIHALRRSYPGDANKVYVHLQYFTLCSTAFNIASVFTLKYAATVPVWINYAVNMLYLLFYNLCAVIFFVYIIVIAISGKTRRIWLKVCLATAVTDALLILTTPVTGWIISFKGGVYAHGPLFLVLYAIAFIIMCCAAVVFMGNRKKLSSFQSFSIIVFIAVTIVAVVIQGIYNRLLIQNFVIALFVMLIYISLQNPDGYMDRRTYCLNSTAFLETAGRYIENHTPFCAVAFTLEDFSFLNGIIGRDVATDIIADTSLFFMDAFGRDRVYHLQGSRYVIFLDEKCPFDAKAAEKVIRGHFSEPYNQNNMIVSLTPFVCRLDYPEFPVSVTDIVDALDYGFKNLEKRRSSTMVRLTENSLTEKRRKEHIIRAIKHAIDTDGFEVYYQPLYNIESKKFATAEALVRLFDEKLGFISPEEFIPIAEKNGLVVKIGESVFKNVCRFLSGGNEKKLGIKYIEVNLSTVQCMQPNLARRFINIMKTYGIDPGLINFEITETAHSVSESVLRSNMETLLRAGASFSMDDYGTGFSTANYLISLPMKIVKIDKSILWSAMEDNDAMTVLGHTVSMLKALRKEIVVEGVENDEMKMLLTEMGVNYLQGFLFSKPLPEEKYKEFLLQYLKEKV